MVRIGVAKPSYAEKIRCKANALKQIEAYELAIKALKKSGEFN